jgi:16S rRNA (cytidine1402-2'-O)-methyltransferase
MTGVLYIVATPIGNLEDISLRALHVLRDVDLVAAEDTRRTQILLAHHGIGTPLTSYHEHNEKSKTRHLVGRLERGQAIALVSDAGTPTLSDPGYRLVVDAIKAGIRVTPIPGASALTAVLSAGGLPVDRFVFEGFLPAKAQDRRTRLHALREDTRSLVFYEAPHRLKESLEAMREILGNRDIVLAREITKVHEEFLRGLLSDVIGRIADREIRGEITLVVRGFSGDSSVTGEILRAEVERLKNNGLRVKEIAEVLGEKYGYSKKEIYRLALGGSDKTTP